MAARRRWRRTLHWGIAALLLVGACGGTEPLSTTFVTATSAVATEGVGITLDVQGHRGARGLRPENTLPAFEAALDLGVSTLELDLHFTADGEVVVWHDPSIDAAKCGLRPGAPAEVAPNPDDPGTPAEDLMISRLTLEQLGFYRCDRNPDPTRFPNQQPIPGAVAGDGYAIPSLAALFGFVEEYRDHPAKSATQRAAAAGVKFNVETKRDPGRPDTIGDGFDGSTAGGFELGILALVERFGLKDRVVVQSFDHRSLWAIHEADPGIRLAALTTRGAPDPDELASRGAAIWSPNFASLTAGSLAAAHQAGLRVIPWTVNDPDDMRRLLEWGVDGLITDRPDVLLELVAGP